MPSHSDHKNNHFDLRTILETSRLLVNPQSPDFILDQLLLILMGRLACTGGMVLMYSPGNNKYHIANVKGRLESERDKTIETDDYYIPSQEPILIAQKHPNVFKEFNLPQNGVLINMQTGAFHMGFIYLTEKINKTNFSKTELEFAESLSIITSVAVYNSRLLKELNNVNRRLKLKVHDLNSLFEISKDFNLISDTDKISDILKFSLIGRLKTNTLFFALKRDGDAKIIASNGLTAEPDNSEFTALFNLQNAAEYIGNNNHSNFTRVNNIQLIVSLHFQNKKVGILGIGGLKDEQLTEEDHNFISSMGNLAVLAIQKNILLKERLETQRIEKELGIAKTIQQGLFPQPIPEIPGFDIAAINIPSYQIGGDYFDVIKTSDDDFLISIADVTGKGVPAALLMANLQSMLHMLIPFNITLKEAINNVNNIIHQNTPTDIFITFFGAKLSNNGSTFSYINAGHNHPILLKYGSDKPIPLSEGGTVLGALPTTEIKEFEESAVELKPGDIILFYTDGLTEARNLSSNEEFGKQRLTECLLQNRSKSAQELIDIIIDEVNQFSDSADDDDLTVIALKKR